MQNQKIFINYIYFLLLKKIYACVILILERSFFMKIDDINKLLNTILGSRTSVVIIKDYENIKKLCLKILEWHVIDNNIPDKERFIDENLKLINIKGMSLDYIKIRNEELYSDNIVYENKNQERKYETKLIKKKVKLNLNNKEIELDVYDTGFEYISADKNIIFSQELLNALKELKNKERISTLADMFENGIASIYLDEETKKEINKEIERRHQENDSFESLNYTSNQYTNDEDFKSRGQR